jgi:hypothetical protein
MEVGGLLRGFGLAFRENERRRTLWAVTGENNNDHGQGAQPARCLDWRGTVGDGV